MKQTNYLYSIEYQGSIAEAEQAIERSLKKFDFGILTKIDVKKTLKEKLNITYTPYKILGICNPKIAYQALQKNQDVGLLLPCKMAVYQNAAGQTIISAIKPTAVIAIFEDNKLTEQVKVAEEKIVEAMKELE